MGLLNTMGGLHSGIMTKHSLESYGFETQFNNQLQPNNHPKTNNNPQSRHHFELGFNQTMDLYDVVCYDIEIQPVDCTLLLNPNITKNV